MRTFSIAAILLLAAGAAVAQAPQQKLTTTMQSLAKSKEAEASLKKQLGDTEREMQAMRERAAGLAEKLQATERGVSEQEEALAKVNAEYAQKKKDFDARKSDYAATVVSLLRMRGMPATAIFASPEDTQKLLRTASVLEKTNEAVAHKAASLREDMRQMKDLQKTVKARDERTRAEQARLNADREKLARELAARQKLQARLNADHAREETRVGELSKDAESLQDLIGKLEANQKEQAKIGVKTKAPPTKLRNFDAGKGQARAPVAGEVIHRFGDKQNANGTYRGMVFQARPGATVVAPYDGEVVFTGPFRDYGNMVLIKHKNGYISLIAGLGKVGVSLNQAAIRGEPIGTTPGAGSGETYVELRDGDAKPIDPADWFANVVSRTAQK